MTASQTPFYTTGKKRSSTAMMTSPIPFPLSSNNNNNNNNNNTNNNNNNNKHLDEIAKLRQQLEDSREAEKQQAIKAAELFAQVKQMDIRLQEQKDHMQDQKNHIVWLQKQLDKNSM